MQNGSTGRFWAPRLVLFRNDGRNFRLDRYDGCRVQPLCQPPQALEIGHEKAAKTTVAVSERARELIQTLYAEDYRRFGYEAQP